MTEAENMSGMSSAKQKGGEASLHVLDIIEASAKFVLSSMNGKTVITDSTVLRNPAIYRGSLHYETECCRLIVQIFRFIIC